MSRYSNSLWASLIARLNQTEMEEEDLRVCSVSIQQQILVDLGFDPQSISHLIELLHERASSNSPSRFGNNNNSSSSSSSSNNNNMSGTLASSYFVPRHPGSVEFDEVEQAVAELINPLPLDDENNEEEGGGGNESIRKRGGATTSMTVEVRSVSSVPISTFPTSEKSFRAARLDSGCQPERLFRFCSRKHADMTASSGNIFDSFVEGFDNAISKHDQVIGRTLCTGFSRRELERHAESCCVIGVDALVTRPITMTALQFDQWISQISDSAEAHRALTEHGATCVQIEGGGGGDDDYDQDEQEYYYSNENNNNNVTAMSSTSSGTRKYSSADNQNLTKLIIFDSRLVILRVMASLHTIRDSIACKPGAIAARGCSKHGNRKFEFWCNSQNRMMCSMCLYYEPELRNDCSILDEAFTVETHTVQSFRDSIKSRQQAVARTLSNLDLLHDTWEDRVAELRDRLDDSFAEIRRLVDLAEADVFANFELACKQNEEKISSNTDLFRRYETEAASFLADANEALSLRDPTRILGVAARAHSSSNGNDLSLGNEEEHGRTYDLPTLEFSRDDLVSALRRYCRLVSEEEKKEELLLASAAKLEKKKKTEEGDDVEEL